MVDSTDRIGAVRTLLKLSRYLGLWRFDNESGSWGRLKRNYRYVLHVPLTFTYVSLMWLEALSSPDLVQAGQVLYMSLTVLAMLVKLINIWHRRDQVWQFVHNIDGDAIYELRTASQAELWQHQQASFKRIFYAYIASSLAVACFGYVSVLCQQSYDLPFAYYVPFEWRNPQRYYYAYGYNVLAMTLACASNATLDTLGCYFMFHIALLYRLLSQQLLSLQHTPEQRARSQLRHIFQLHMRVRQLTQQCELLVSPYVLSQVVLSAFIICFSGYRLLYMNWRQSPGLFVTTVQFVCMMIVQIFLPCYYGNEVTVHAHQLTNSVFHTNWLNYSVGTRKLLNTYMELLKRPVKLRAGHFFEIGLPIFVKTINNAYTFLALLLNISK